MALVCIVVVYVLVLWCLVGLLVGCYLFPFVSCWLFCFIGCWVLMLMLFGVFAVCVGLFFDSAIGYCVLFLFVFMMVRCFVWVLFALGLGVWLLFVAYWVFLIACCLLHWFVCFVFLFVRVACRILFVNSVVIIWAFYGMILFSIFYFICLLLFCFAVVLLDSFVVLCLVIVVVLLGASCFVSGLVALTWGVVFVALVSFCVCAVIAVYLFECVPLVGLLIGLLCFILSLVVGFY